jgi:hypothetical protein
MTLRWCGLLSVVSLVLAFSLSCAGDSSNPAVPIAPGAPELSRQTISEQAPDGHQPGHHLWGFYLIYVKPERNRFEIVPVRGAATHWNVLEWLEQGPCTDCLKITNIEPSGTGTLLVDIEITHPFSNPNLTGFDVRGIAMFTGSHVFPVSGLNMPDRTLGDGELVNADGYTTLYNISTLGCGPGGMQGYFKGKLAGATPPNALLNGFKRFVSDDAANTRNAFYAGDAVTVTYEIDMPDGPFVFGYAVDACWAPPINKPVDDPMTDFGPQANSPEPWKIEVSSDPVAGDTTLTIDVYDWKGKGNHHDPLIECPEVFDGTLAASWIGVGAGYTRYQTTIFNGKSAPDGHYECLISAESIENDPTGKPWLDLTAYQAFLLHLENTPKYPVEVNSVDTPGYAYGVAVSGGYAYVAAYLSGLAIINIDPPESAYIIKAVDTPGVARGVAASAGYAYVADYESGLQIIDIDPPESAYIVKSVDTPGQASGVAVSGRYAYVADGSLGFQIIDIESPESAYIVQSVFTADPSNGVAVSGGYAYVVNGNISPGLQIVDIEPPESAYIVKTVHIPVGATEVAVSDGFAYVADGASGLQIIDIDPPESAHIVKSVDAPSSALGIAVQGGYAYIADNFAGLQIADIDPPQSACIISSIDTPGEAFGVAVSGAYTYVADKTEGLRIIKLW